MKQKKFMKRSRKRKINKENIIKKSILRITVFLMIIALNWSGLLAIGKTAAYFFDKEDSKGSFYQAGILDFYLFSPTNNFIPPEIVSNMMPGDSVNREISIIKESNSNLFQYAVWVEKTGGNDEFCNALTLEAQLEGEVKYTGSLMSFYLLSPILLGEDGRDDWFFTVILPEGSSFPPGEICQIKFVFDGWQINLSNSSVGFSDREEIESSFATGGMKINKVYYDVDSDHGEELLNEWVEIYNPLNSSVDISGWEICDNTSCDILPSSPPIPPKGFAIITGSATTWNYWEVPDEVVKIVLEDGEIGNGLSNDSDRVILKMPGGIEDDAMSYGEDHYAFEPPCPDVEEGHMLGRVPSGFDTNQASDWKDLSLPQLTVESIGGAQYCGRCNHSGSYYCGPVIFYNQLITVEWTATNYNGPDSALSIDIFYITDNDCSGTVSDGDNFYLIAENIPNTGSFSWRVHPYFYGYVWFKVIAKGPENFMIEKEILTNPAFEPSLSELESFCSLVGNSAKICLDLESYLEIQGEPPSLSESEEMSCCSNCLENLEEITSETKETIESENVDRENSIDTPTTSNGEIEPEENFEINSKENDQTLEEIDNLSLESEIENENLENEENREINQQIEQPQQSEEPEEINEEIFSEEEPSIENISQNQPNQPIHEEEQEIIQEQENEENILSEEENILKENSDNQGEVNENSGTFVKDSSSESQTEISEEFSFESEQTIKEPIILEEPVLTPDNNTSSQEQGIEEDINPNNLADSPEGNDSNNNSGEELSEE